MRRACVGMVLLLLLAMDGALATARTTTAHTQLPAGEDEATAGEEEAGEAHPRLRYVHSPELVGTAPLREHVAAWDSDKLVPRALPFTLDWALSERFGVAQTKRAWALFSAARGIDEQRAAFPALFEAPSTRVGDDAAAAEAQARVELMLEVTAARAELAMHAIVSHQQQVEAPSTARTVGASLALRQPAPALGEVTHGLDAAFAAFDDEYGVIVERYGGFSADGMRAYIRDETVAQWERARRMARVYMVGARGLNGVIDDMVENLRSLGRGTLGLAYLKGLSGSIDLLHEQKRDLNDATHGPIARGEQWFRDVDEMLQHVRAGTPVDTTRAAHLERALRRWVGNYQAISDVVYTFNSGLIAELDRSIMKTTLVREVSVAIAITIVSGGLGSAAGAATAARVAHLAARTQQIVSVAVRTAVLGQRGVQLALKAGPAVVRAAALLQRGLPVLARFSTSMLSGGATKWLFTRLFAMEALLVQGNFAPEAWQGALQDKGLHEFLQGMLDGLFTGIGGKAVFGYAATKATLAGRWMVTRMLAQAAKVRYVMPASSRALFANAAHATRTWMGQVAGRGVLSGRGADRLARLRSALQRVLGDKAYAALVHTGQGAKHALRRLGGGGGANDLTLTAMCNVFLGGVDNLVHHMVGMMTDPAWKDKTMRQRMAHLQDQLYRATVGGLIIESVLLLGQPFMPLARRGAMRELFTGDHSRGLVRESLLHAGTSSGALRKQLDDLFVAAVAGGGKNAAGTLVRDTHTDKSVDVPEAADLVYLPAASLGTDAHVPTWTKTNALLDVGVWRTVHGLAAQMTILAYMKRPHETPSFADVLHMERVAMDVLGLHGIAINDRVARIVYAFVIDSIDDMRTSVFAEQVPVLREVLRMGVADDELAWRLVRDALHIVEEAGPAAASLVDDVARVLTPNAQYPDGCRGDAECSLALRALGSIRTPAAGDVAAAYLRTAVGTREARGVLDAARALHAVATGPGGEALGKDTRRAYAAAMARVFDTRLPRYHALRDDHAAVLQMLLGMGDDAVRHVLPTLLAWATDKEAYFSLRTRQYRREVGALLRAFGGVAARDRASAAALVQAYMVPSSAKARAEHMWAIGRLLSGLGADALTPGVRADVLRHMRSTTSRSGPRFAVDMLLGIGSHDALIMLAHGAVMPDAHVAVVLDEMRSDDTADIIDTFLVPLLMELVNKGDAASDAARAYLTAPHTTEGGGTQAHPNRVAAAKCLGWLVEADVIAGMWHALPALPTPEALARGAGDAVAAAGHFTQHLLVVDAMWAHTLRLQNGELHWSDEGREEIDAQLTLFIEPLGHVLELSKSALFADPHAVPPLPLLSLLRRSLFTLGYIGQPAIRLAPEVMRIMQTIDSTRGTVRSLIGHAADALIHWVKRIDDHARLRTGGDGDGDEGDEGEHVLLVDTSVLLQALANAAERAGTKHEWVATDMCGSMRWLPVRLSAPMEATVQRMLDAHPTVPLVQSRCGETLQRWRKARGSEATR